MGQKYLKQDFTKVIWTVECRATINCPDGWAKGCVLQDQKLQHRFRWQQGEGD